MNDAVAADGDPGSVRGPGRRAVVNAIGSEGELLFGLDVLQHDLVVAVAFARVSDRLAIRGPGWLDVVVGMSRQANQPGAVDVDHEDVVLAKKFGDERYAIAVGRQCGVTGIGADTADLRAAGAVGTDDI